MFDLYTAVVMISAFVLIITAVDVTTNRLVAKRTRMWAVISCVLIGLATLGEWLGVVTNGAPAEFLLLHKLAKAIEFSFAPTICLAVSMAYGKPKALRLVTVLVALHWVFEWVAMAFGWVFTVDEQNVYHRESLYFIYVIAFILSILYTVFSVVRHGKAYQAGFDSVLIWILMMLTVGIGVQFIFSGIRIDYLCISIVNMLFYIRNFKITLQVDAVTQLLNRRCYDVKIMDLGPQAVILLFDIDKFKQVNDTYGHSVGDFCLKNVAEALRAVYGKYGLCYRTGGDEFCVILHDGFDKLEALNQAFDDAIRSLGQRDSRMPGVSMGYAYYDAATSHIQTVIEEADAMLYRNKNG